MIQRICEEDPSLRELQAKLKMAYVAKERSEQIEERKVIVHQEVQMTRAQELAMEEMRVRALEEEKVKEAARKEALLASKAVIQKQLEEKQIREYIAAEEEGARERAMIDEILSKIRAEDEIEVAARAKAKAETAALIEGYRKERERAKAAADAAAREEEERIAAYMKTQLARDDDIKRAKAEDAALREAQYRKIVAEQEALRKRLEEEEALRWLLVEEESEKRRLESDKKRKEQIESSRRDMLRINEEQRKIRDKIAQEEARKEAALIQQFLEKCAEDDKKEAELRRIKAEARVRYMAEIASARDEKIALYQKQKLEEMEALEEARRKDAMKKKVVQEARRRILQEHAAVLRGFLPRGVILSSEDLEILKAFDRDGDGRLSADEMELAQAAFNAYDPNPDVSSGAPSAAAAGRRQDMGASAFVADPASGFASRTTTAANPIGASAPASRAGSVSGTSGLLPGGGGFYGERKR